MPDISNSVPSDLPSTRQLIRSTVIAAVIAAVLLVSVVLPAEYGVDPIGIGRLLGLTEMGRIKASLAGEVERENASHRETTPAAVPTPRTPDIAPSPATNEAVPRSDVTTITLQPDQGREIKLSMREGASVTYTWSTDRGEVNHDMHADSTDPPRDYHSYRKAVGVATDDGVLIAAFEGWHGWYWRNLGAEPLTVTLRTAGDYRDIKEP